MSLVKLVRRNINDLLPFFVVAGCLGGYISFKEDSGDTDNQTFRDFAPSIREVHGELLQTYRITSKNQKAFDRDLINYLSKEIPENSGVFYLQRGYFSSGPTLESLEEFVDVMKGYNPSDELVVGP